MKCKICSKKIKRQLNKKTEICSICLGKPFKITSICREDMLEHFSPAQIAKFGDKMMEDLANRISSAYLEHSFWIDLEIIVDFMLEVRQTKTIPLIRLAGKPFFGF